MLAPEEGGIITLEATEKEGLVEVIFIQGEERRKHEIKDNLFLSSQLPPSSRRIHAIMECVMRETSYQPDPSLTRKNQLKAFVKELNKSEVEEFRELSKLFGLYLVEEWTFTVMLIIIILITLSLIVYLR